MLLKCLKYGSLINDHKMFTLEMTVSTEHETETKTDIQCILKGYCLTY